MPAYDTQLKKFQKKLLHLARHPWLPAELLHLAGEVMRLQEHTHRTLDASAPLPLPQEALATPEAHQQGQALLRAEDFPYDAEAAANLWNHLLELTAGMPGPMGAAAEAVRAAMTQDANGLDPGAAFAAFTSDNADFFAQWEQRLPAAPAMVRFLAQASLTPWLVDASARLAPWHDASAVWEYGHCPHCGHMPLLGQLRGREGARWHVCSFCQLAYRVPRLQCPVCQEKDVEKLRFFSTDQEADYEVHVCETCKNYLKLHVLKEKDATAAIPPLDDLDSLPLDLMARQQGYIRSTASAWGF